jgi:heme oxygenase
LYFILSLLTCRFPSSALEKALESHATHPALEPTYNPTLLERAPSLAADISHLLDVDESSWKYHPIHINLMAAYPSPLSDYVQRIEELSNSSDPSALLAHSYVRYLGDLSGGQTIRHTLAKAYNLDEAAGFGLSFYKFKELRSSKVASQGEMKRIKDWFREGMNVAGERNFQLKGMSSELKIDIYTELGYLKMNDT